MLSVVIQYFENEGSKFIQISNLHCKAKNNFDWELFIPEQNSHIPCFGYQVMVRVNQT